MMVPWQIGIALIVLFAVVIARISSGSPRDYPGGWKRYLLSDRFGLALLIPLGILLFMATTGLGFRRVYVIHGPTDWSVSWALGSPTFKFANGETAEVRSHAIVNNTDETFVLESVVYGTVEKDFPDDVLIHPYSAEPHPHSHIQYFFDNRPPQSITIKGSRAFQWWLRRI